MKDLAPIKDKFFIFVSKDYKALNLSQKIAGGVARVGSTDPQRLAALGLKVVDLSLIDDASNTNHTKFADSPEIVQLIGRVLNQGHSLTAGSDKRWPVRTVTGQVVQTFKRIPSSASAAGAVLTMQN